jgi:DNA-directed RNA polymerase subunit RPC12/RpoP
MSTIGKVLYECPACGRQLRGSPGREGTRSTCPACGQTVELVLPVEEADPDEGDDYRPPRRQHRQNEAWGCWVVGIVVLLTMLIPLVGIVLGIMDMGSDGPRKRQGIAFLAVALFSMFLYSLALFR